MTRSRANPPQIVAGAAPGLTGEPRGGQLVGRRRGLPTGRAVLGGLLVAIAAVAVFSASLSGSGRSEQSYAVAAQALPAGTVIESGDLTVGKARLPASARDAAFEDPTRLVGRSLAVPITAGELIQSTMLAPSSSAPTWRPVSVGVDPTSVENLVPGQPVDVLATTGSDTSTQVTVVVRGASLLDINRGSSSILSGPSSTLVTVGVATLAEVEQVVEAAHAGTLELVAAEPSDGVGAGPTTSGS